mgnify:CR=1 FL=1
MTFKVASEEEIETPSRDAKPINKSVSVKQARIEKFAVINEEDI